MQDLPHATRCGVALSSEYFQTKSQFCSDVAVPSDVIDVWWDLIVLMLFIGLAVFCQGVAWYLSHPRLT